MIFVIQIPEAETRRINIHVEENATYVGLIQQKSKDVKHIFLLFFFQFNIQDNLDEDHEKSTTIKFDWIESKTFLKGNLHHFMYNFFYRS